MIAVAEETRYWWNLKHKRVETDEDMSEYVHDHRSARRCLAIAFHAMTMAIRRSS